VARAWLLLAGLALAGALALAWWSLPTPAPTIEAQPRAPAEMPPAAVRDAGPAPADAPPAAATVMPAPAIEPNTPNAPNAPDAPDAPAAIAAPPAVIDEAPAARKPPAHEARPTPRKNSPNPRCTEIITRASLGEPLSAHDEAMLKGECRK